MAKKVPESRKKARKRIIIESFLVVFVVLSPFFFKMHEYFSSDPEATINILGYIIDRNGFANLSIYAWFMLGKVVPLYLFVIWFFTCKHWWYHAILIPITMYAFQIFEVIFSDDRYVDTDNLLWLLPVCMVVIPIVYFIRIKLYDKYVHGIDLEAMEEELRVLKAKQGKQGVPPSDEEQQPQNTEFQTLSEKLDQKLSTQNLELGFKQFQHNLKNWLHLKF